MHLQNNLKEREEEWEGTKEERGREETGKEGKVGKERAGKTELCEYSVLNFSKSRPHVTIFRYLASAVWYNPLSHPGSQIFIWKIWLA